MRAYETHSDSMLILDQLVGIHRRDDCMGFVDVYCVLDDEHGESRRAPDVVLARKVKRTEDGPFRGTPILAVEVRATQSRKHLDEKVKLYIEHDWPLVWLVHTERHEVEVVRPGLASVVVRLGSSVPLIPELDKYGLTALPVTAFFDQAAAATYLDRWVRDHGVAQGVVTSLLSALTMRGLDVPVSVRERISSCTNLDTLQRWFSLALTATNRDEFVRGMG